MKKPRKMSIGTRYVLSDRPRVTGEYRGNGKLKDGEYFNNILAEEEIFVYEEDGMVGFFLGSIFKRDILS